MRVNIFVRYFFRTSTFIA